MTIKLEDFVLEQTISEASVIDIELEQAVAEIEVASAMMEAYFKQLDMIEDEEPEIFEEMKSNVKKKLVGYVFDSKGNRVPQYENVNPQTGEPLEYETPEETEERVRKSRENKKIRADVAIAKRNKKIKETQERLAAEKQAKKDAEEARIREVEEREKKQKEEEAHKRRLEVNKQGHPVEGTDSQVDDTETGNSPQTEQLPKATQIAAGVYERGVKAFFKSIGNWFVKIWTKFIGWVSEKRLKGLSDRLNKIDNNNLLAMKVELPIKLDANGDVNFMQFCDKAEKMNEILTRLKKKDFNGEDVQTLIEYMETFKHSLRSDLQKISASSEANEVTTINGEQVKKIINSNLARYTKNKTDIQNLNKEIIANKNIGNEIINNSNIFGYGDREDFAKLIYRSLKSVYDIFSTYMSKQLQVFYKILNESNLKSEMNGPSGKPKEKAEKTETPAK